MLNLNQIVWSTLYLYFYGLNLHGLILNHENHWVNKSKTGYFKPLVGFIAFTDETEIAEFAVKTLMIKKCFNNIEYIKVNNQ